MILKTESTDPPISHIFLHIVRFTGIPNAHAQMHNADMNNPHVQHYRFRYARAHT